MQKTAYEMRISDWSSDVCSSDLLEVRQVHSRDDVKRLSQRFDGQHGTGFDRHRDVIFPSHSDNLASFINHARPVIIERDRVHSAYAEFGEYFKSRPVIFRGLIGINREPVHKRNRYIAIP